MEQLPLQMCRRERGALGKSSCQQLHVLSRSYTCTSSHIPLVRTWHPNSWRPGSMILPGPWERESQQQCRTVFLTTAKIYHCASLPFKGRGNMTLNQQLVLVVTDKMEMLQLRWCSVSWWCYKYSFMKDNKFWSHGSEL